MPELLTPAQVAEVLHTSPAQLAQFRYLGTGPRFVKVGKRVYYTQKALSEFLAANTYQRTGQQAIA
jgi:hypothetical protein